MDVFVSRLVKVERRKVSCEETVEVIRQRSTSFLIRVTTTQRVLCNNSETNQGVAGTDEGRLLSRCSALQRSYTLFSTIPE